VAVTVVVLPARSLAESDRMNADEAQQLGESLIVLQAQAGDRPSFHKLVDLYQQRLMYFVRRLVRTPQECEDVLQEAWLKAFRSLGQLQSPQAFRVWLYRIAYYCAMTQVRHRDVVEKSTGCAVESDAIDCWDELLLLENVEFVHAALERLSLAHREVLTLRFLEDMDVKEIAEVVGCSEGTAKSRLHYAKRALRSMLEEDGHA
jgi:RNA polymerase sigma-70 factor, ECF subfamily